MNRHFVWRPTALACLASLALMNQTAWAADTISANDLAQLRQQMNDMRQQYETRLKAMEERLQAAEQQAAQATTTANTAAAAANNATAPEPIATAAASGSNGFNPAVSVVLSGTYAQLKRDPDNWRITGFATGDGEIGPGNKGFNLGESEATLAANIDPWWYGALTLAFTPENEAEVEEAFVQTTALGNGLTVKAGRFFSAMGYQNEQHAHAWDFVDAPLAYQAFLGGQYKQNGVQAKWVLPTEQFIELGGELGNGDNFPGTQSGKNGAGAVALFGHLGGDVGDSGSWRAGLSHLWTQASDRESTTDDGTPYAFTGNSRLWVLDGVWKWAPNGNTKYTNVKLQGEYFYRDEKGRALTNVGSSTEADATYRSAQSGWYLQGVYQFMPAWRVGLRYDRLDTGSVKFDGSDTSPDYHPNRTSLMLDWSPSEFSRWRLQFTDDRSQQGVRDGQIYLQYLMSLGSHGAHSY